MDQKCLNLQNNTKPKVAFFAIDSNYANSSQHKHPEKQLA